MQLQSDGAISQVFGFDDMPLRVAGTPEAPLFVAKDVCACLEIADVSDAVARLDEDERGSTRVIDASGRKQEVLAVTESGLYRLTLTSRKPEAKRFQRWVIHEVLPSIRKTGHYLDTRGVLYAGPLEPLQVAERWLGFVKEARAVLQSLGGIDAKDEFELRDLMSLATSRFRRSVSAGAAATGKPTAPSREPRTVVEHLIERGIDDTHAQAVGRFAAGLYKARYHRPPEKLLQRINGRPTEVCVYRPEDVDLVEEAIALMFQTQGEQPHLGRSSSSSLQGDDTNSTRVISPTI
jgi:prophage antirepressor-like protein